MHGQRQRPRRPLMTWRAAPPTKWALGPLLRRTWPLFAGIALLLLVRLPVEAYRSSWPTADILDAIRQVESGGREAPPDGDDGHAIGPFQIHRPYWADAVASEPALGGSYQDCRKRAYAERVVAAYMQHYAKAAWTGGRGEIIARIHNGGPDGHRSRATLGYWRRVRALLPP